MSNIVYEKTRIYRDSLRVDQPFICETSFPGILAGVSLSVCGDELNVIDFGGACGAHYFLSKAFFGERIKLRWRVVETPKMVSKAVSLKDGELEFFDDLRQARSAFDCVHLVISSGALQYVPRPYEALEQLVACRADNLFLTRLGLSNLNEDRTIVQSARLSHNGPGPMPQGMRDGEVQFPVTISRKEKFEEVIKKGYSIKAIFNEDKDAYHAENLSVDMYGYFCTKK